MGGWVLWVVGVVGVVVIGWLVSGLLVGWCLVGLGIDLVWVLCETIALSVQDLVCDGCRGK